MKRQLTKSVYAPLVGVALVMSTVAVAQTAPHGQSSYYQGKGRIAVSADGNCHDNDDMQATMASLMILARAGLQDKTPLYVYADHIWGNEQNDLEIMRVAAEVTGEKFDFDKTQFLAGVEDPEAAYQAMSKVIMKSTAKDPLFIIGAGPMQVIGEGLKIAQKKKPKSLKYVTVISHSLWNDRHSDKPGRIAGKGGLVAESHHEGWTWDEMKDAFGQDVFFHKIKDQNGGGYNGRDLQRFKALNWENWRWMSSHDDENVRWIYEQARKHPIQGDFSDAGMLYYLCADLHGVRGDEDGNPEKLRQWMGAKPAPAMPAASNTPVVIENNGKIVYGDDFIAIKSTATDSELGKNWKVRTKGTPEYASIKGEATTGDFIEYMGSQSSGATPAGQDILVYKFRPLTSGVYRLTGRMAQHLSYEGKVSPTDHCNDVYIKMEGDYKASQHGAPQGVLTGWSKFYGRGYDKWGAFTNADVHHKKYALLYELEAGKEYTLSISGRSQRICIDYFLLTKAPVNITENFDLAQLNASRYRAGYEPVKAQEPFTARFQSIHFDKFTDMGEGFVDATVDRWRKVLQVAPRLQKAAAEVTYNGPSRNFNIDLNTLLEADGESTYEIFVNHKKVGSVVNERIHGTETKDYKPKKNRVAQSVQINPGDVIRVEFNSATNGKVPEGDVTATARGRWLSLDLICNNN